MKELYSNQTIQCYLCGVVFLEAQSVLIVYSPMFLQPFSQT